MLRQHRSHVLPFEPARRFVAVGRDISDHAVFGHDVEQVIDVGQLERIGADQDSHGVHAALADLFEQPRPVVALWQLLTKNLLHAARDERFTAGV